jgi:hypothetical protein
MSWFYDDEERRRLYRRSTKIIKEKLGDIRRGKDSGKTYTL